MKPLSEFAKELVESKEFYEVAYQYRHAQIQDQREVVKRFEKLKAHIEGELQAWLREAEKWTRHCDSECDSAGQIRGVSTEGVRRELLGTTQEGKK